VSTAVLELPAQWQLALLWVLYFALHSLLASRAAKRRVAAWPPLAARYRLLYNGFAVLSLLPIVACFWQAPGPYLWRWTGLAAWIANGLAAAALIGMWLSARSYDMVEFLGLRAGPTAAIGDNGRLRISPWHRYVRHPWYALALILVWTRDMSAAMLVSAILISLYFVIGSRWEEAKLIAEFGDRYRRYRQRVPGLIPLPGRVLTADEAAHIEAGR
jgi:protein-S-isoprenylcysteine O-methyltransferase Ste14